MGSCAGCDRRSPEVKANEWLLSSKVKDIKAWKCSVKGEEDWAPCGTASMKFEKCNTQGIITVPNSFKNLSGQSREGVVTYDPVLNNLKIQYTNLPQGEWTCKWNEEESAFSGKSQNGGEVKVEAVVEEKEAEEE